MNHLSLILFPVETPLCLLLAASRIAIRKEKERGRSLAVPLWKGPSGREALVCMHVYVSDGPWRQLPRHLTKALVKLSAGLRVHKRAYVHVHACVHVALTHVKSRCACGA